MEEHKNHVHIVSWPKETAQLEHKFNTEKPCPISVSFEKSPANVIIHTTPERPLNVDMNMNVIAKETIPVCVKLCEPICAKSDYTIGIQIFDRPVGAITIRGLTRLFNCREEEQAKPICIDFKELKENWKIIETFTYYGLRFSPLGEEIRTVTLGDPPGQVKLAFPREGIRIDFPYPVNRTDLTVNNYAGETLNFAVYAGTELVEEITEEVNNEVKMVTFSQAGMTAIEITGGDYEASLVQVCYQAF